MVFSTAWAHLNYSQESYRLISGIHLMVSPFFYDISDTRTPGSRCICMNVERQHAVRCTLHRMYADRLNTWDPCSARSRSYRWEIHRLFVRPIGWLKFADPRTWFQQRNAFWVLIIDVCNLVFFFQFLKHLWMFIDLAECFVY